MADALLTHPLTYRLGWTLLHAVWQGLALSALFGSGLLLLGGNAGSRARHGLATTLLLLWLAAPIATFALLGPSQGSERLRPPPSEARIENSLNNGGAVSSPAVNSADWALPLIGLTDHRLEALRQKVSAERLEGLLPPLALGWLVIAAALCLRLVGGLLLLGQLATAARPLLRLQPVVTDLSQKMGLGRSVRILRSTRVDVPTAFGWLRPVILLPASALTGLDRRQLELILAHELAHIRRNDFLLNIAQGVTEALLWYHPFTWWVGRTLRLEREHVSDRMALRATGETPFVLAQTLTHLETNLRPPQPALTASGYLTARIRQLLAPSVPTTSPARAILPTLGVAALGLWLAAGLAQTTPPSGWSIVLDPGHSSAHPGSEGTIEEELLNLEIAKRVQALLEAEGIEVILTRENQDPVADEYADDLRARAELAAPPHDLLLSIHAGAAESSSVSGPRTFVAPPQDEGVDAGARHSDSKLLAEQLQSQLEVVSGNASSEPRVAPYAVLRWARIPAVLVDVGFLTNPEEAALLATDQYQDRIAAALADGVLDYLRSSSPERQNGSSDLPSTAEDDGHNPEYQQIVLDTPAEQERFEHFIETLEARNGHVEYHILTVAPRQDREYFIETPFGLDESTNESEGGGGDGGRP